ncbi:hypothetical protein [Mycobacterium camsae]|uniref:hypothetical protein n=1 Tax=Mycobacterium gordonae TaxID=1778 RepID=UPI00198232E2|nr:hypothetical protein [Mycobacterium gordonae]
MTIDWHGPVNQLLYSLTFTREITDDIIQFNADSTIHNSTLTLGPDVFYKAINEALASGDDLKSTQLPQYDHAAITEFLTAVADRLDALRPSPLRPFHQLDAAAWAKSGCTTPIALIDAPILDLTNLLNLRFSPAGSAVPGQYVSMIRLCSGEIIALLGSSALGKKVALLADISGDPDTTIERFITSTGIPPEKVVKE